MASRVKKPCRRRNCAEKSKALDQAAGTNQQTILAISSDSEGERLWRHVCVGTGTCVSMIEQYFDLGMPGLQIENVIALSTRLQKVISKHGARNANSSTSK